MPPRPGPGRGGFGHRGRPGGPGGFGGPPPPGWGWWLPGCFWAPPGPGERMCWLCWWCAPPPPGGPPPPGVVIAAAAATAATAAVVYTATRTPPATHAAPTGTAAAGDGAYHEIRCDEYRNGDKSLRYYLTVPADANHGDVIKVDLDGREFHVTIPDYVELGETVIIIAPAPKA